jgi:hypothetical protein
MLEVVEQGLRNFGRPPKLSRADQLLLTLMYWREYRTEFHIGLAYGISESAVCRTIKKIENTLIKSEQFHLPSKRAFQSGNMKLSLLMPQNSRLNAQKKTAAALQRQKEMPYSENPDNCRDEYGTDSCRLFLRRQEA